MNLLVKRDPELGYAYFCPICKHFLCSTVETCPFCGQSLDWEAEKTLYNGPVKWLAAQQGGIAHEK